MIATVAALCTLIIGVLVGWNARPNFWRIRACFNKSFRRTRGLLVRIGLLRRRGCILSACFGSDGIRLSYDPIAKTETSPINRRFCKERPEWAKQVVFCTDSAYYRYRDAAYDFATGELILSGGRVKMPAPYWALKPVYYASIEMADKTRKEQQNLNP